MPRCKDNCLRKYYKDAVSRKNLHYWDEIGFKRCQCCNIYVSVEEYPETYCKCCSGKFRLRCRVSNKRKETRPYVDYFKESCVVCGIEFKKIQKDKMRVYRFNPRIPGLHICQRCYGKKRYQAIKLEVMIKNKKI